ncbi:MAG: hypothetical protein ACP5SK_05300, partial [Thermoprotei archaeon]
YFIDEAGKAKPFGLEDTDVIEGFKDRHEGWSKWIQAVRFSNGKELVINHSWEKTAAGGMELIPKGYAAINP